MRCSARHVLPLVSQADGVRLRRPGIHLHPAARGAKSSRELIREMRLRDGNLYGAPCTLRLIEVKCRL